MRRPASGLHIDITKLGRVEPVDHRITGNRTHRRRRSGWECLFLALGE